MTCGFGIHGLAIKEYRLSKNQIFYISIKKNQNLYPMVQSEIFKSIYAALQLAVGDDLKRNRWTYERRVFPCNESEKQDIMEKQENEGTKY